MCIGRWKNLIAKKWPSEISVSLLPVVIHVLWLSEIIIETNTFVRDFLTIRWWVQACPSFFIIFSKSEPQVEKNAQNLTKLILEKNISSSFKWLFLMVICTAALMFQNLKLTNFIFFYTYETKILKHSFKHSAVVAHFPVS